MSMDYSFQERVAYGSQLFPPAFGYALIFALNRYLCSFLPVSFVTDRKKPLPKDLKKLHKFQEMVSKLFAKTLFTCLGFYTVMDKHYWKDLSLMFKKPYSYFPCEPDVTFYYTLSLGYYIYHNIFQFWEPTRKDWLAMTIHHWVTLLLIFLSYSWGYTRVGVNILFIHEPSDCILTAIKLCRFIDDKMSLTFGFVAFFMSWVYFRFYIFFLIIREASFCTDGEPGSGQIPFCMGLTALYVLHWYWFCVFIIPILWNKIIVGKVSDLRSDNEEELRRKTS